MKSWNDLLEEPTPPEHEARLLGATREALSENAQKRRQQFWFFLATPSLTALIGIILFSSLRRAHREGQEFALIKFLEDNDDAVPTATDLEFASELDLLEDLEDLEDWSEA